MASREPSSHKKKVKNCNRIQPPPTMKVVAKSRGAVQDTGRRRPLRRQNSPADALPGCEATRKSADMAAFYDYIKGNLKFESSKEQLRRKVNRLKQRYLNALKKGKNGENPVFSNPPRIGYGGTPEGTPLRRAKIRKALTSKRRKLRTPKIKLKDKKNEQEKENYFNKANANGDHRNSEMMRSFLMGKELKGFDKRTLAAAKHLLKEGEMEDENQKTWKKLNIEYTKVLLMHSKAKTKQAKHLQQSINS
ncbi:DNA-binding storekeeper protein-relatedtranscriptional regulator [Striga asiatica]|uniref:DNA-binding storekeeper protein-relatedtranscriptional regulator n=1 Tax=Striga asiatica TaxID=4170 RepID=A0A5A7PME7_STRAF|nr:DNA-binding storekeeper protein-relatedtranscriptional regulator [Striga asiatica]